MGNIIKQKLTSTFKWQEPSLRKSSPRRLPPRQPRDPATSVSSHAVPRSVYVVPRHASATSPQSPAVDPDPVPDASFPAAPRSVSVVPRHASPRLDPSAVEDPAKDASYPAAPRSASVAPKPARLEPRPSAAEP